MSAAENRVDQPGNRRSDRVLQVILRVIGCTGMLAYPCALFPYAWMNRIAEWAGLGPLPDDPIVGYLARSLSFFYGMTSTLVLICSTDIDRYRTVIRAFGALAATLGVLLLIYDASSGMPRWWITIEGVPTILAGTLICWLAGRSAPKQLA